MQVPNTWLFSTSRDCLDKMWVLSYLALRYNVIHKVNIFLIKEIVSLGHWRKVKIARIPSNSKVDVIDSCQIFCQFPIKKAEDGIPLNFQERICGNAFSVGFVCWEKAPVSQQQTRFGPRRGDAERWKNLQNGHICFRYIWHPELFLFGRWVQPSMPSCHYILQEVRIWREKLQISSDHWCIFCVVFSDNNGHDADAWRKLRGWTPCGPGRRGRRGRGQVVSRGRTTSPTSEGISLWSYGSMSLLQTKDSLRLWRSIWW